MSEHAALSADPSALRIAVVGPGGVGGLLATLLATHGNVVCLAGADTVTAITERGLHVSSEQFGEMRARVQAAGVLADPVDVCLVTVKAPVLEAAMQRVPPTLVRDALIVPLLNGVEHVDYLRRRYPAATVAAATIKVESTRVGSGDVRHSSPFASIALAEPAEPAERGDLVGRLVDALGAAGLDVVVRGSEADVLWQKLCFLAPMALLTTRAAAPIGTVRAGDADRLRTVTTEVCAVARAAGAAVEDAAILAALASVPATMRSSMQRDAAAGRPTELDAIGGAVIRAGRARGVPTPGVSAVVAELAAALPA